MLFVMSQTCKMQGCQWYKVKQNIFLSIRGLVEKSLGHLFIILMTWINFNNSAIDYYGKMKTRASFY